MKTPEEIREEALIAFPVDIQNLVNYDEDINEDFRTGWEIGYQSAQSSIEPEIEKRVEERMKEYKEELKNQIEAKKAEAIEESAIEAICEIFAYDYVLEIIELINKK